MDIARALRIARHHWVLIASIVIATSAIAVGYATLRNDAIEPLSRAEAPITFISDIAELNDPEGALIQVVQAQIEEARTRALEVNAQFLADPANDIVADPTLGRLTFIARHSDPQQAVATASEMRRRLIARQPVDMDSQIEKQLAAISAQMDRVRDEIVELEASMSLPADVLARRERLTVLLEQLESQALELERQLLVPSEEDESLSATELQAELDVVERAISDVTAELAEVPAPPSEFSSEMTERRALERQFRELENSYQELLLQRSELSSEPIAELVDVFDETPDAISRRTVGAIAFLLGLAAAAVLVLVMERLRRPLWFPSDVPQVPFLPAVPTRSPTPLPWYIHTGDNERKRAIQTLRSSIRARARSDELVVGIAGAGVSADSVRMLGVDLALSFASTHAATALVEASGKGTEPLPELHGYALSLESVASEKLSGEQIRDLLSVAKEHGRTAHSSLTTIAATEASMIAADVLAGPHVGFLFEALRQTTDVVVVVAGDVGDAATLAILDRIDLALVLTAPGAARMATLVAIAEEMTVHQIDLAGVMLRSPMFPKLRSLLSSARDWLRQRRKVGKGALANRPRFEIPALTRNAPPASDDASRAEAHSNGVPKAIKTASEHPGPVDEPVLAPIVRVVGPGSAVDVAVSSGTLKDPRSMLQHLDDNEPALAKPRAEEFLVDWITALVQAREDVGLDPTVTADLARSGFVPLSTWKGNPSLGSRLRHEFRRKLGKRDADRLETLLLRAVGFGVDPSDVTSLDRWASRHYFAIHAAKTGWEPPVWHLTSPKGTVSALVAAERFDSTRIERFVDNVVIRAIEVLARRQHRKELFGDSEATEIGVHVEDARTLGLALAWLMDGSHADSRLWYPPLPKDQQPEGWAPDWEQGMKWNIAPLQRLGILAVPVLTDEELQILDPTG